MQRFSHLVSYPFRSSLDARQRRKEGRRADRLVSFARSQTKEEDIYSFSRLSKLDEVKLVIIGQE